MSTKVLPRKQKHPNNPLQTKSNRNKAARALKSCGPAKEPWQQPELLQAAEMLREAIQTPTAQPGEPHAFPKDRCAGRKSTGRSERCQPGLSWQTLVLPQCSLVPRSPGADSEERVLPVGFLLRSALGTTSPTTCSGKSPSLQRCTDSHTRLNQARLALAFGG